MAALASTDLTSSESRQEFKVDDDLFGFDDDDDYSEYSKPCDPARSKFEEDIKAAQQISKLASQIKPERRKTLSEKPQEIRDVDDADQKRTAEVPVEKITELMNTFVERSKGNWYLKTLERRNFLHFLAYSQDNDRSRKWILKRGFDREPKLMGKLMGEMDDESRTPLVAAVAKRNRAFCNAVFESCITTKGDIDLEPLRPMGESLISECQRHNSDEFRSKVRDADMTCLHAALTSGNFFNKGNTKSLDRAFILTTLIQIVPQKMFTIKDSHGLTPLHLAVHYDSCNMPSQFDIVKRLLERAPEALDEEFRLKLDQRPEQILSIFQYHQRLRGIGEKKYRQLRQQRLKDEPEQKQKQQQQQHNQQYQDGKTQEKEKKNQKLDEDVKKPNLGVKGSMGPPSVPDPQRPNFSARRDSTLHAKSQAHNAPQLTSVTPVLGVKSSQLEAGASPKLIPSLALGQVNSSENERTKASDQISQHLKLLGLRCREPHNAARFLGNDMKVDDKMLWFDFGPRKKLSESEFKKSFGHLQFDSILHYVALPQIDLGDKVTGNNDRANNRQKVKDPAVSLFRWLRDDVSERRVKKIIRVMVDDFGDHTYIPHSDEGVEKALQGFDVEILDWRRSDICPASLRKIGEQSLREIRLYWSGQNPVLRAWSEEDGLCKLPNLKKITVIQIAGIESEERTDENFSSFKDRLERRWSGKSCPIINFSRQALLPSNEIVPGGVQPAVLNSNSVNSHKWLTCMKKFSQEFREVVQRMQRSHLPASSPASNPVVIALIDDGTDIHHADLISQPPFRGGSFDRYFHGTDYRIEPWWYSASGHGTLMARLITGICPSAVIRVIKLKTLSAKNSDKLQIDVQSAIDAIKYATTLEPDIISMSWTVRPAEEDRANFTAAIHEAAANPRGILMFCAASDQGQFNDVTFPFAGEAKKFRIGAADAMGRVKEQVGDQDKLDFILPGHDVVIDQWYDDDVKKGAFDEFEAHSGSSVATALAAGLAALIVECVRLGVIHTTQYSDREHDSSISITDQDLKKIHEHDAMKIAMEAIGTDANTNRKYLKVWDLFDNATANLRKYQQMGDFQGQLGVIAGLARLFLKKGA